MKRAVLLFIVIAVVGCAPLKRSISPVTTSTPKYDIDNFFAGIMRRNSTFNGFTGTGRIILSEGRYEWSAIFKLYIYSRDSATISIYGPLGMKVFTIFIKNKKISFDRKTDYEAIADLLQSSDLVGNTFTSILSSVPLIDTQTVRIDSSRITVLKYGNLSWFYSGKTLFPDSLYIGENKHVETIVRYEKKRKSKKIFYSDIYSVVFDAHLKIYFNRIKFL